MILPNKTEGEILRALAVEASATVLQNLLMLKASAEMFNLPEMYYAESVSFMETTLSGITAIKETFGAIPMEVIVLPSFLERLNIVAKSLLYAILKAKNWFLKITDRFQLVQSTMWKSLSDLYDSSELAVDAVGQQISKMHPMFPMYPIISAKVGQ